MYSYSKVRVYIVCPYTNLQFASNRVLLHISNSVLFLTRFNTLGVKPRSMIISLVWVLQSINDHRIRSLWRGLAAQHWVFLVLAIGTPLLGMSQIAQYSKHSSTATQQSWAVSAELQGQWCRSKEGINQQARVAALTLGTKDGLMLSPSNATQSIPLKNLCRLTSSAP